MLDGPGDSPGRERGELWAGPPVSSRSGAVRPIAPANPQANRTATGAFSYYEAQWLSIIGSQPGLLPDRLADPDGAVFKLVAAKT